MQKITVKGHAGGQVTFDGGIVEISKKGLAAFVGGSGAKRIPVRSISAIQVKSPGILSNGFIQFTISGGNEVRAQFGRQTFDAGADENSVLFTKKQEPEFLKLRDAIEATMYGSEYR